MKVKRLLAVGLAMGIPTLVVGLGLIPLFEPGLPRQAQAALSQFQAYRSLTSQTPARVEAVVPADRPGYFAPEMSAASFGEGIYFSTTHGFSQAAQARPTRPAESGTEVFAADSYLGSLRTLPYPPEELWCVLTAGPDARQVVFVALHQDLYIATWVIHEGLPGYPTPAMAAILERVGCQLSD